MNQKKIGIIGGTFDPIHNGHLRAAEFVFQQMNLDEMIFVPAYIAPHKIGIETALPEDRLEMVKLAVNGNKNFIVSDIELTRKGISYTYETLKEFRRKKGSDVELFFVIGMDSLLELDTWHNVEGILELATIIVATRPGFEKAVAEASKTYCKDGQERIKYLNAPGLGISSTEIRRKIQNQNSLEDLLPSSVIRYIKEKNLYTKRSTIKKNTN